MLEVPPRIDPVLYEPVGMNKRSIFFLVTGIFLVILITAYLGRKTSDSIITEFKKVDDSISLSIGSKDSADYYYRKLETALKPDELEKIKNLKKAVADFNTYIDSVKVVFRKKAGDSESAAVTAQYFEKEKNGEEIYLRRTELAGIMSYVAISDSLKQGTVSMTSLNNGQVVSGPDEFTKVYFHDSPPVAALTILAFFRLDISNLEMAILKEYSNLAESRK